MLGRMGVTVGRQASAWSGRRGGRPATDDRTGVRSARDSAAWRIFGPHNRGPILLVGEVRWGRNLLAWASI